MKIEKNIPMPPRPARGSPHGRKGTYRWREMEVGDSFFVEGRSTIGVAPPDLLKRGWKFESRTVDGGIRVWRTR